MVTALTHIFQGPQMYALARATKDAVASIASPAVNGIAVAREQMTSNSFIADFAQQGDEVRAIIRQLHIYYLP